MAAYLICERLLLSCALSDKALRKILGRCSASVISRYSGSLKTYRHRTDLHDRPDAPKMASESPCNSKQASCLRSLLAIVVAGLFPVAAQPEQELSLAPLLATVVTDAELCSDSLAIVDIWHITPLPVCKYATNCLYAGSREATLLAIVVIPHSCACLVRNTLSKRQAVKSSYSRSGAGDGAGK